MKLSRLIANVESNDNQWALRFEPGTYMSAGSNDKAAQIFASIIEVHACSRTTAQMIYSTSWGKYQLMGFNLYGPMKLTTLPVGQFLAFPKYQDSAFLKFLVTRKYDDLEVPLGDDDWMEVFARWYNGPANVAGYVKRVREVASRLTARDAIPSANSQTAVPQNSST